MSGALAGLSQYVDSDSEADEEAAQLSRLSSASEARPGKSAEGAPVGAPPLGRLKRKLPSLEADALEQDATSSTSSLASSTAKKVARGDWLCYCFVEVLIDTQLSKCVREAHDYLQQQLGSDDTLLDLTQDRVRDNDEDRASDSSSGPEHLHISLTRPLTVRSYERDEFVKVATAEVKRLKASLRSFAFSFSRLAHLANDDASRHFMVLEVGSGREQLHTLSTALSAELRRAFRAKSYYDEARFHASTTCLITPPSSSGSDRDESVETLGSRFGALVDRVEVRCGSQLRKCPPVWAGRIGVQVANRVTYVDL
ncbi:U6 snRNA phosphodiesterase Usb1 [Kalmanozyma brasiliensis GHG001]|uniref:U6 snRNA phosphodiesterase 1 n=1 Tax=Kalmanozyma brasiliensis (strain GHG001) TaxID=1365824 RepID=V5GI67_KALBG|nr:U6 snRNA phosphodiesterase Usb1 [Kalmanozyma brasiliensis GHG001]EST05662.1 U6 snRNA phosphodiesterase Usb1 [Kalmanozyma brasiliensis GHG001]